MHFIWPGDTNLWSTPLRWGILSLTMPSPCITTITHYLAASAGFLYGLVYLGIALGYSLLQKEFWVGEAGSEKLRLERASRELWSLAESPEGLSHNFLDLADGARLHYLSRARSTRNPTVLVLLLHGFPDSCHLFTHQLRHSWPGNAKLVALDLPGCGGSDSSARYGPDQVLNVVAEAIVKLKDRYVCGSRRCVLVGHDWGAVIGFRLAAESIGLIDHLVTLNSLWPAYAEVQLKGRIAQSQQLLSVRQYGEAARVLSPVLSQLGKSSYTYLVTLPFPLAKWMPRLTSSLLRVAHALQYKQFPRATPDVVARRLAMAYGPGDRDCRESIDGQGYGPSVFERAKTNPPGDWDQRVKLYAEGLLREQWKPSYPGFDADALSRTTTLSLKCPVSIIFGLQDVALDSRIAVDGIEKYFYEAMASDIVEHGTEKTMKSSIMKLPNCGHWSVIEQDGMNALEEQLNSLLRAQH